MDNAIYKYNVNAASGERVKAGRYVVGPSGQLVLARMDAPIKDGWRLATQGDIAAASEKAQALNELAAVEKAEADAKAVAESEARDAE